MKRSPGFPGFPEGKQRAPPVPNLFFSELLPTIDSLVELKITLYAFWALGRKEGRFRYLTREEMAADKDLLESLAGEGRQAPAAPGDAPRRGVGRPAGEGCPPAGLPPAGPNVLRRHEQNSGPLTPMIAEARRDAEETYPS